MPLIGNKIKWCLNKAQRELKEMGKHRGLVKIAPDTDLARQHISKAEHNLTAMNRFKEIGFSDWSASAGFYSIYHCLLAIIAKHGYESRNQECTFALIYQLIDSKKINLDRKLVEEVHSIEPDVKHEESTIIELRESEQYGTAISMEDKIYNKLLKTAQKIRDLSKEIIEATE